MTWVLILFVTVGPFSERDSMALTSVPDFRIKEQCEAAGKAAVSAFGTGTKRANYVCVQQNR